SGRCPGRTDAMVRITSPRVQKTKPEKLIDAALMGGTLNARASYLPETFFLIVCDNICRKLKLRSLFLKCLWISSNEFKGFLP
ncbi:MAG: hypothetical protein IKG67_15385, partial [Parasporobacterium sp.]|nr:hypothetical protein [Parasporobacterium sp.]